METNHLGIVEAAFPRGKDFFIVGIGASAGGIKALQDFFRHVRGDSGMAYVVILHLSPDHDSKLAEIIRTVTDLPVSQVVDQTIVEPNNIYVIPPNKHLVMDDGKIAVSPNMEIEDRRAPVDIFFRTLAESHRSKAVAVVLSGTGANGSMGIKRIKERGGITFVQSPRQAEFSEMPRNSMTTEMIDEVLPVEEIPGRILAYRDNIGKVTIPEEPEKRQDGHQLALREIFTQLRVHAGHDFSNYKRQTLLRRVERRINIRNMIDLPEYAQFIKHHPEEVAALLKDLLISVTNFFRDKKAFEFLETEILPDIFKNKKKQDEVRIWVAGCATGEEAYSLAMLCAEQVVDASEIPKIQIFATDIDESAIAIARDGLYSLNDAADVSPERLKRFFNREGDSYRVRRDIREMILFAFHNFINDPPFSHLDLVSCRNVLIYLNRSAQERVMETFHFALRPGSYLLLGSSESIEGAKDIFADVSREDHVFQSRNVSGRSFPVPNSVPPIHPQRFKPFVYTGENERSAERITYADLHQRLLEEYAPPSMVVDADYEVLHLSPKAGHYLQVSGGEPSQNLLKLIKPELRLELRSALYQAIQRNSPIETRSLRFTNDGLEETINIHVRPVLRDEEINKGFLLILFERVPDTDGPVTLTSDEPVATHLENELERMKSQLRSSMEQHDFSAEELKASNEELQAMNEELRSAAEELETSKEELQSINEELRTVNQELKIKIEETTTANNNLQNLINSVGVGTIFLDRTLNVVFFTPAAREVFNLLPADHGRQLSDITNHVHYPEIIRDAEAVLNNLRMIEREVVTDDNRAFLMRLIPYRTSEDRINGIVITFFDISVRKDAEEKLRNSEARFRGIVSQTTAGISETDIDGKFVFVNDRLCAILGYSRQELLNNMQMLDITFGEDRPANQEGFEKCVQQGIPVVLEKRYIRKNGTSIWVLDNISLIRDGQGMPRNAIIVTLDIHERKISEEALNLSEARFRQLSESGLLSIAFFTEEGTVIECNDSFLTLTGYTRKEMTDGQINWNVLTPPEWIFRTHEAAEELKNTDKVQPYEKECFRKNGSRFWGLWGGAKIAGRSGNIAFVLDITSIKALEKQKDAFIGIASHELKTPVTSIKAYAELLKEILEDDAPDKETLSLATKLNGQVDRLTKLVQSLLDTTKISEGQLVLQKEFFDFNDLVSEQVEEMQRVAQQHEIKMNLASLKPVHADRERLAQVLTNIISNAIKYSPNGKDIVVSTEAALKGVALKVQDFGIGMSEETQTKIFDRFYRVSDPAVEIIPGIGLGLYICSEIIKQHGGTIGSHSMIGKGSVFYFTIPYIG